MILNKNNNKNNKNKNTHRERKVWRARKFCQTFSAARRSSALHHRHPRACPVTVLPRGIPHGVRSRDGHISSLTHFFRGATRHIQIRHLQNLNGAPGNCVLERATGTTLSEDISSYMGSRALAPWSSSSESCRSVHLRSIDCSMHSTYKR